MSDLELDGLLAELIDVALVVDLVGALVVHEEVGGTLARHPLVEHGLGLVLRERLLLRHKIQISIVRYAWRGAATSRRGRFGGGAAGRGTGSGLYLPLVAR